MLKERFNNWFIFGKHNKKSDETDDTKMNLNLVHK